MAWGAEIRVAIDIETTAVGGWQYTVGVQDVDGILRTISEAAAVLGFDEIAVTLSVDPARLGQVRAVLGADQRIVDLGNSELPRRRMISGSSTPSRPRWRRSGMTMAIFQSFVLAVAATEGVSAVTSRLAAVDGVLAAVQTPPELSSEGPEGGSTEAPTTSIAPGEQPD